jgi:hypothetical protein
MSSKLKEESWEADESESLPCMVPCIALLRWVMKSEVVCRGELKDTGFVSDTTLDRMKALGVI